MVLSRIGKAGGWSPPQGDPTFEILKFNGFLDAEGKFRWEFRDALKTVWENIDRAVETARAS